MGRGEDRPGPPAGDTAPEPPPPETQATGDLEKIIARRRQRLARRVRASGSRWSEGQIWLFVILALVFLGAWIFGRDACSRKLGQAFDTVTGARARRDAGARRVPDAAPKKPPGADAADDGW